MSLNLFDIFKKDNLFGIAEIIDDVAEKLVGIQADIAKKMMNGLNRN